MPVIVPAAGGLVSLGDLKPELNIDPTDTSHDGELLGFINGATTVAEEIAGNILPRTITGEVCNGGGPTIQLRHFPIISITSVMEYVAQTPYSLTSQPQGSTVDNYGYELIDPLGGVLLRRGSSGMPQPFLGGYQGVVVSYIAGYAIVPANVRLGALELIRHWYQKGQQGGRRNFQSSGGYDDGSSMIAGFLVPNFAASLLGATPTATKMLPGIA